MSDGDDVTPPTKPEMLRCLSTLHGLFPGQDWRTAHAVNQWAEWAGGNRGWGKVSRQGISWWPDLDFMRDEAKPEIFIPWREVVQIIARGGEDGRRERYEAASKAYGEHAAKSLPDPWLPATTIRERGLPDDYFHSSEANQAYWAEGTRIGIELSDAKADIIATGCELQPQELMLW